MDEFYTTAQRELQDEFDSRALADRLSESIVLPELQPEQSDFVEAQDCFFLSTIDDMGFPSVSYKGGAKGLVRAINAKTLVFPAYDGNGMFMSMGNIASSTKIGLLFINFEQPRRLRVRGSARLIKDGPLVASYPGAIMVVELTIEQLWQNCPRYIPQMQRVQDSPYVPDADGNAKFALWKRIDLMQDVLSAADRTTAESVGLITAAEYQARVEGGEIG